MRRLLVDYARQAKAVKRGVSFKRVPLNAELAWITPQQENLLDLSAALEELYAIDEAKARAIELRYFLGCTVDETASSRCLLFQHRARHPFLRWVGCMTGCIPRHEGF